MRGMIQPGKATEQVKYPVNERATLRFAMGVFDAWPEVDGTVRELIGGGMSQSAFSVLGLCRVLALALSGDGGRMPLRELPFPANREVIGTTIGPLADRLAARLAAKADTPAAALGHWLIPRHAVQLQDAVVAGKIILLVQLFDNDDERRACQSLLARSSNSVGVHDIVGA
jgi:hypothetical protein